MITIPGIFSIILIFYLFYIFFIKGYFWAILLFVFGTLGGSIALARAFPNSTHTVVTVGHFGISYGMIIAFAICLLGVAFFAHHDE
jgi:hypothetical protein